MVKLNNSVCAHFKLIATDASTGKDRQLTGWFPNLVLDSGLDRMSQGVWINRVLVGSGNSTPNAGQVALDSFIASTTLTTSYSSNRQMSEAPFYYTIGTVFRFDLGLAAGNLSEIALGWGNDKCWNRALIRDAGGNPTTITVLTNEYLDVYVEIRIYPNTSDSVSNIDLLDENSNIISTHEVTVRANMFSNIAHSSPGGIYGGKVRLADGVSSRSWSVRVVDGGYFNGISSDVSGGATIAYISGDGAYDSYPTLRSCAYKQAFNISDANGSHEHISIMSSIGDWKLKYNPPITKNNTQTLEHNFVLTWDRYEPT